MVEDTHQGKVWIASPRYGFNGDEETKCLRLPIYFDTSACKGSILGISRLIVKKNGVSYRKITEYTVEEITDDGIMLCTPINFGHTPNSRKRSAKVGNTKITINDDIEYCSFGLSGGPWDNPDRAKYIEQGG